MKLYGFWRSLASYRVRVALAFKGLPADEQSIDLMKGVQHTPEYRSVNPQAVLPALDLGDGQPALFQSMAILEYLEETHPQPPLLPADARGRARVRGLAQIVAADSHPLVVPRVREYLEREMHQDETARMRWCAHWTGEGLRFLEARLAREPETGRFCHGDAPTMADICLASHWFAAKFFKVDAAALAPTAHRIFTECQRLDEFDRAQPSKQPGAPPMN